MGFGSLLGIPKENLNHDLILALANAYNPSKFHLLTPIGKVDVTWDSVAAVFGFHVYGDPFKDVTKEHEPMLLEFKKKSPNALRQIMLENPRGGPRFRRAFSLYAFITFLLSINTTITRDKIFPFVIDIDNLMKYNWIRCIVDGLADGVNNFKEGVVSSLNWCIYVLQRLVRSKEEQHMPKRPVRPKKSVVKEATKVEKEQSEKIKVVDSPKKDKKESRQEDSAKSTKVKKQQNGKRKMVDSPNKDKKELRQEDSTKSKREKKPE
ncbi:myb-like protein X [Arachis ipaensis]|uniref:myb-like protein X n=1 Tax=Arachis ipaensis TaxID=130454 RepID=UPI000A2AF05F|nr:myb-like protein X [Arachis ipaensis]XP_029146105.1 myb-like protein X [Arachis hypogaea]